MADQDTPPSRAATPARAPSRAETRMAAVAKLKRAASLPRMKDGRRPPMHVEAVSEGEKPPGEQTPSHSTASNTPEPPPLPTSTTPPREDEPAAEGNGDVELTLEPEVDDLTPVAQTSEGLAGEPEGDGEAEAEPESDPDEGGPSAPTASTKKRRTRSRTRSRASKDLKARLRASQQAMQAPLTGDSSPEPPMMQPSFAPPGAVLSPIPHLLFLQPPNQFLRPGTPGMYPGTNPPTPLPTLEDIQQGLMRSNSAGAAAAGRRAAMHKLTGGTESYDPVPVPTSPLIAKLSRNNTVAGGERIAARRNMMNLLGTRVNKEAEAEAAASGAEERNATSPTPKRRKRRSRRASSNATATAINVSESDYTSTNPNTPAYSNTGLPAVQDYYDFAELRAQSTTPNQLLSSPLGLAITHNFEDPSPPPLPITVTPPGEEESRGPALGRRRSILIEEPDDDPDDRESPEQQQPYGTPRMGLQQNDDTSRSDGPSSGSTDGVGVPVFLSGRASSRNDVYPSSPFTTPLKEVPGSDEDEERVLYPPSAVRPRTPYANQMDNFDREISWIASPVPEIRMPIHDEDDYDDDDDEPQQDIDVEVNIADYEEPPSATSSTGFDVYDDNTQETFDENSPPASSSSKSVLVESETSPEPVSAYMPASPSSPVPHSSSHAPSVDGSSSPQFFPTRLSVASRMGGESSDWEEKYNTAEVSKRQGASTWEKVMNTLSRAGSSAGRRSRTNSIVARERRDNTDSSISRESGASMASSRTDKGDGQFQAAPLMQTPSASASISSLAPHGVPPRGSVSPIPPPLSSDLAKYQSAKLFPFPGIMKLKEERQAKADAQDDVSTQTSETHSNTPTQTPDMHRERELAQPSEGPVFPVYMGEPSNSGPSSPGYGYINVSPSNQSLNNSTSKLPTTLPGVKQWLSKNSKPKKLFSSGTFDGSISSPTSPGASPSTTSSGKKTFIGDVFGRKTNDVSTDFEEPSPGISPHFGSPNDLAANRSDGSRLRSPAESDISGKGQNIKSRNITPLNLGSNGSYKFPNNNATESAAARFASPTPVASSLSDYPAPSASDSSSTTSSNYSLAYHSQVILDRLDESLTKPSRAAVYADDPPRKLILSSPVLQVVNPNTVKDRFLFLFNDILVIAKPVTHSQDNLMDSYNRMSLPDRKYTVKSVVQLRNLRFFVDRSDTQGRLSSVNVRNPLMHSFVAQFAKEPEHAIGSLFTKANVSENGQIIGQLLFKTLELDRSRLGGYLALRSSKTALKYYLDSFGFAGLRIDVALRVFLQSINLSQHPQFYTAVEHLLDAFASRWYEANAKFVPYDKDMAIRIVWALAQLNERLHGGIADEAGETDHSQRTVSNKEFVDAFRKYDVRGLVSDDLLHEVYKSVYHERLSQARLNVTGHPETSITIKRPLPSTLTYKAQSDPIVFRLPAVDPDLTIELYGQDLIFEPSVLHFQKSSEVSFRVTGTSLGPKTISMLKSGPNAINYSGLPLSHTVNVERSFMRHTFQVAFLNQTGSKRRYMFSVDDPIIRNEWATCIRRHVELSILAAQAPSNPASAFESKLFKASSDIAFKVLQDTLMAKNTDIAPRATDSPALQKKNGAITPFSGSVRSKSRSRMYHKYGAGKNEEDLQSSLSRDRNDSTPESDAAHTPEYPLDGSLWTARDLEIQCQQNSAIPHILAALQVGLSDRPPS